MMVNNVSHLDLLNHSLQQQDLYFPSAAGSPWPALASFAQIRCSAQSPESMMRAPASAPRRTSAFSQQQALAPWLPFSQISVSGEGLLALDVPDLESQKKCWTKVRGSKAGTVPHGRRSPRIRKKAALDDIPNPNPVLHHLSKVLLSRQPDILWYIRKLISVGEYDF